MPGDMMCLTAVKAVMEFGEDGGEDEQNNNERKLIRRPPPTDRDRWNALPEVPKHAEMGYLHLSFEYHKGVLKVRVWQISDLLLPPPQISMIHSIFVRGYFIPDKVHKTLRRTEDIVVDVPQGGGKETPKTGIQHIFTPSSFKFRNPLLYTGVTSDIVKARSLQLEVCMKQKQSQRTFLMAMVHMPLRTAVRRPIREKYPLIPCMNITIPNNMRVYSATDLQLESSKGGNPRVNGRVAGPGEKMPVTARDVELEDVVSLTGDEFLRSHLQLCLDLDESDDYGGLDGSQDGRLREVRVSNGVGSGGSSSTTTLNMPSSEDEDEDDDIDADNDDDDDIPHVITDSRRLSNRSTPVDMSAMDRRPSGQSTKKKIIPNELLETSVSEDFAVDMPAEETVVNMDVSQSSESLQESAVSSPSSVASDAKLVRKKIIPAEAVSPSMSSASAVDDSPSRSDKSGVNETAADSESSAKRDDDDDKDDSSEQRKQASPAMTPKKKKIAVLPGEITLPADSLPPPSSTAHSSSGSEGLSPHGGIPSDLSPLQDSAFTPASRPETPCWDFYDFSEDMQPEEDAEVTGHRLEASLSQLRQQDVSSWQNRTNEPILPMVLVDDFDTLAVDAEQSEI